jgi:predicted polyphosphate/ATP-dependent NAD kinase
VVPDWEKVNIVRRAMLGLQSVGVDKVLAMPDSSHLVLRAADDPNLSVEVELLRMSTLYNEGDTVRAAAAMSELGVGCVITLGGDGTNRAVAKGASDLPLVAISTGTNNVFPVMVEGTTAGMAAGLVANGIVPLEAASVQSKTIAVFIDGEYKDIALVDVALSKERFVATRAIWDMNTIYEVFLTRAEPSSIGLSSIGARLEAVSLSDDGGLHYRIAEGSISEDGGQVADRDGQLSVRAPIAPGSVPVVGIESWQRIANGQRITIDRRHSTVALDGERSFSVNPGNLLEIEVRRDGPPVVSVDATMRHAAAAGVFHV